MSEHMKHGTEGLVGFPVRDMKLHTVAHLSRVLIEHGGKAGLPEDHTGKLQGGHFPIQPVPIHKGGAQTVEGSGGSPPFGKVGGFINTATDIVDGAVHRGDIRRGIDKQKVGVIQIHATLPAKTGKHRQVTTDALFFIDVGGIFAHSEAVTGGDGEFPDKG